MDYGPPAGVGVTAMRPGPTRPARRWPVPGIGSGTIPRMPRPGGPGRPSKGDRKKVATSRLPRPLYDALVEEADRIELSMSETLANIIAAHYGHPRVATPVYESSQQTELAA